MKRGKRGQFYIVAAIILILILVGAVTLSNYTRTNEKPEKFYDMGKIMELEGIQVIDNLNYRSVGNLNENLEVFFDLFANYTIKNNPGEDFNMIIVYGDVNSGTVNAVMYSSASSGEVNAYIGNVGFRTENFGQISRDQTLITVQPDSKTVNLTLNSANGLNLTEQIPILTDNNFVFIMTTSSGFNQYVQSNIDTY